MGLNDMSNRQVEQKPVPPAGVHVARCYQIIELGAHEKTFPGKPPKDIPLVYFGWEIPAYMHVFDENRGPQPLAVFQEYTASLDVKSKLNKDLRSWRGLAQLPSDVKLKDWLNQTCMINIVHSTSKDAKLPVEKSIYKDGKMVYANVNSVMPLMQGANCAAPVNNSSYFDFDDFAILGINNWSNYLALPKWMQDKISKLLWVSINGKRMTWNEILIKWPMPGDNQVQQQAPAAYTSTQTSQAGYDAGIMSGPPSF
jgi:hypothetical protein